MENQTKLSCFPRLKVFSKTQSKKQAVSSQQQLTTKINEKHLPHNTKLIKNNKYKYINKSPAYYRNKQLSLHIIKPINDSYDPSIQEYIDWKMRLFDKQNLVELAKKKLYSGDSYKKCDDDPRKSEIQIEFEQSNYENFPKNKVPVAKTIKTTKYNNHHHLF